MSIKFEIPPDHRFTCSQCGDCCRTWMIPLGPGEAERLATLQWPEAAVPPAEQVRPMEGNAKRLRLARRDDGACILLGERNQCLLHEHFGAESKPLVCRLYPFAFMPMGARVAVDVSYFCRAVSESHGDALEARVPEWTKLLETAKTSGLPHAFQLTKSKKISADALWDFEFHLIQFLKDRTFPFHERLRCCFRFLELTCTGNPDTDAARLFRAAIAEGVPNQVRRYPLERDPMNAAQSALFFQDLFLALNPAPLNTQNLNSTESAHEKQRRLHAAEQFREQLGHFTINNIELSVTFENAKTTNHEKLLGPDAAELFERFFIGRLIGQRFLFAGEHPLDFIEAVHRLMLAYPWSVWTAKALAADAQKSAAGIDDLRHALRLLDRSIGQGTFGSLREKHLDALREIVVDSGLVESATSELLPH